MSSQAGVFYFDQRPVPHEEAQSVASALGSRDTDARGDYRAPGLFMAHAASWLDELAARETQPHTSPSGNTITFDGRLDNREDLLLRLCSRTQRPCTDAVLALTAYEVWGEEGLVHLVGDWSTVIAEPATRTVILASDYAGVRPLYYSANQERVLWSSYLKPLISWADATDIDDQFVAGFLTGHGSPGRTPYRGILAARAGQALRFSADGVSARPFWKLPVHSQVRYRDERQYDEQLRALFRESVRTRLRTSHPVCSELSGGLDSSSVVCMASGLIADGKAEAPRLMSISFGPPGAPDEKFYTVVQRFAEIESAYLNTDHLPFLHLDYLDEASPAPWGALFHEAANRAEQFGAKVHLTGQGGDLMMGNWVDDSEQLAALIRRGQFKKALVEALGWSKATRVPAPTLLWRALLAALPASGRIPYRYQVRPSATIRESYRDSVTQLLKSKTGVANPGLAWSPLWKAAPPERRKHFQAASRALESGLFRAPERLQHVYYAHPYMHRPLVEFLLAIPADVLCRPGEPRRLMRRAFHELLPPEVVRRRSKASFTGVFLKSVRPAARALLTDMQPLLVVEHGYVEAKEVFERLERMSQSLDCNEPQLRSIVLLELWLRARRGIRHQSAA